MCNLKDFNKHRLALGETNSAILRPAVGRLKQAPAAAPASPAAMHQNAADRFQGRRKREEVTTATAATTTAGVV